MTANDLPDAWFGLAILMAFVLILLIGTWFLERRNKRR